MQLRILCERNSSEPAWPTHWALVWHRVPGTLAADAKVTDTDCKACKLDDLKKGQRIRVTTKEGDTKIATRVEALKNE